MPEQKVTRRLAAILAADMVGYSRLVGQDEEGTLARLKALREELIDPGIADHNGRIVKTMGDGILVEFASVVDAVRCAVEVQHAMEAREGEGPSDRRIAFRVGINLGDIVIDGDDILGDGVNVAARLEGLAEPGGICVSGDVYRQVNGKLDLAFEDLGEKAMKNIRQPVQVYRVRLDGGGTAAEQEAASEAPALALPDKPSIAVLPFANMSGDPEQEYFSDGITEDIITELSQLRWLFVISRNSSFTYRGKAVEVKRVAEELGVRYVLEGSVRKAGNRVRITAQLIDAPKDRHVWAQRFDRDLEDIFALQDEIASQIVATVNVEIGDTEQERVSRQRPESLDAWELYQRGMWHLWRLSKQDREEARTFFGKAIDLSPTFASPYAGLAYLGCLDVTYATTESIPQILTESLQAGEKAVELDDRDSYARYALGRTHGLLGNRDAAIAESEKAIQLSPSFALAHYGLGYNLLWFGRAAEAIPEFDTAIRLSPHDPVLWAFHIMKGLCLFHLGDHVAAEASARMALREGPKEIWPHLGLASALAEQDRMEEARAALADLARIKPTLSISTVNGMLPHMDADFQERLVAALRKAGMPE
jgi:adenylate cyclase